MKEKKEKDKKGQVIVLTLKTCQNAGDFIVYLMNLDYHKVKGMVEHISEYNLHLSWRQLLIDDLNFKERQLQK